jgi:hypothetical protein
MQVDQRITLTLRATMALVYLWASKVEGFSTILMTSEKEEQEY